VNPAALAVALLLLAAAGPAPKCRVTGVLGGKKVMLTHCAAAYYDSSHGVTLWFSASPISWEELTLFETNAYPKPTDPAGKPRTMMHLMFCPGGGKAKPDPKAVESVEVGIEYAEAPMLSRQWVFDPRKDKEFVFEKLSGDLKPGGRLAGLAIGAKISDKLLYSWKIDFDLPLPQKDAAAGPACGSSK